MINAREEYTESFSFTQDEVNAFAELTGDNNPIHWDASYAEKTPFKKPIMHGFLSGSIFSKIIGTKLPGNGTIYVKQTMEFMRPMFVDVEYEAEVSVLIVDREKHKAILSTSIIDRTTGKTTLSGEAIVINKEQI